MLKKNWSHNSVDSSPFRSNLPEVLCKIVVLKNFTKFAGKQLCQRLLFNKVVGLSPATLLKKYLAQVFSCKFCEIVMNTFFYRTPLEAAFIYCSMFLIVRK